MEQPTGRPTWMDEPLPPPPSGSGAAEVLVPLVLIVVFGFFALLFGRVRALGGWLVVALPLGLIGCSLFYAELIRLIG